MRRRRYWFWENPYGKCENCQNGYAISYEGTSCILSPGCDKLEKGNQNCADCSIGFLPNSNGQCERSLCTGYENNKCKGCQEGYFLKDNQCQKIAIEYCIELDTNDQNKCAKCLGILADPVDGKCIAPATWVKGCVKYDEKGKCRHCGYDTEPVENKCDNSVTCETGEKKVEYCLAWEAGFYADYDNICVGYDGTKDDNDFVKGIKVKYDWIIFLLLAILI